MSFLPRIDPGNVLRGSFEPGPEGEGYIRTRAVDNLAPANYKSISLTYNSSNCVTGVVYYAQDNMTGPLRVLTLSYDTNDNVTGIIIS